jgi:hypothetical protein
MVELLADERLTWVALAAVVEVEEAVDAAPPWSS